MSGFKRRPFRLPLGDGISTAPVWVNPGLGTLQIVREMQANGVQKRKRVEGFEIPIGSAQQQAGSSMGRLLQESSAISERTGLLF